MKDVHHGLWNHQLAIFLVEFSFMFILDFQVEQIFKDENIMPVYDILDHYCEFLTLNLSYIRRNKYVSYFSHEKLSLHWLSPNCFAFVQLYFSSLN